jgi:WD40-like Beta Propeller Repeat
MKRIILASTCFLLFADLGAEPLVTNIEGEILAPGVISLPSEEISATFTPNGQEIYFVRTDFSETDNVIFTAKRQGATWSTPQVAAFSGTWRDSEPAISPDGKRFFFTSNRPYAAGEKAGLIAEMRGRKGNGSHIWYMDKTAAGWSTPIHLSEAVNSNMFNYNPSAAKNGDLYFSSHRDDSGPGYQVYVAALKEGVYQTATRVDLGDVKMNRMDPAVDPDERFMLFAGDEGDSLGSADLYISFRGTDGRWGKPEHLPAEINSPSLEHAASMGRAFGELFVTSPRAVTTTFPKSQKSTAKSYLEQFNSLQNGTRNIWRFDISSVLVAHGIKPSP